MTTELLRYVDLGVATSPTNEILLTDAAEGRIQRDILDPGGAVLRETIIGGTGMHGGTAGRQSYVPSDLYADVDVFATWGATEDERNLSYRDNLRRMSARFAGRIPLVAVYPDGSRVRVGAIGRYPFPPVAQIRDGNTHRVGFTPLDFWRDFDETTQVFDDVDADPYTMHLTDLLCTAPMTRVTLDVTGPSDPLRFEPLSPLAEGVDLGALVYDKGLDPGEVLTIKCTPGADNVLVSTIPANVDRRKLSHPGNPSYLLEIPRGLDTGLLNDWPRLRVYGQPAAVSVTATKSWLSL